MTRQDQQENGGHSVWLAFAAGALIGGVVAVLLAPRSGAETRRRLASAADDSLETASRLPQAIRAASAAAQDAFATALKENA